MALIRDPIYRYFSKGFRGQPRILVWVGTCGFWFTTKGDVGFRHAAWDLVLEFWTLLAA